MKNMFGPQNSEEAEVFAVERLRSETQYCIESVMNGKGISRSELARKLGCSPANVTQMLSEYSNLTLVSVAKLFHALGDTCIVKSRYLESQKQSRVAANEDYYPMGSFGVLSMPYRDGRRIAFDSDQQGVLGSSVQRKALSYFEYSEGIKAANNDVYDLDILRADGDSEHHDQAA